MTDMLLEVTRNPAARRVARALRVPVPPVLERASGPWRQRELAGRAVGVIGFATDELATPIAHALAEAGAGVRVIGSSSTAFARAGDAFGERARPDDALHGLVVDATRLASIADLYDELHPWMPAGRLVVLANAMPRDPEAAAVAGALEGFVRSAAKELGRRGATAQLVAIEPGAEARAAAIVRFLLSARSAFVTAQRIRASTAVTSTLPLAYTRSLDRKVALVTGAARGIGEATARRLADEGAHVVCIDRPADEAVLAAVATAIGGSILPVDLADATAARRIADHLRARHGGVDIVVHNAGITRDRTFAKMTKAEWSSVIEINLLAVMRCTAALLPRVLRDHGRMICLSSVAGIAGNVGQTSYAASKAGLIGFVGGLSRELAPRGITVNAVAPGFIETRMTAAIPLAIREAGRRLAALGQGGLPADVAEAIAFLAQPAAVGITGATLRVCGGALIGA